jgi:SAM-dependent methyltransferase
MHASISEQGRLTDREPLRDLSSEVEETMVGYDQTATQFAARWGDLRLERALHVVSSNITGGPHSQARVLDLGCGPGRDVDFLTQLGCQVVGLDLSAGMLAKARARLPGANLVRADFRQLPFGPGILDGAWACASLLHLRRIEFPVVLGEIVRLLRRPGGLLYLALKGGQGERWEVDPEGRRYFFAYYDAAEIQTLLLDTGFQILEQWQEPDRAGRRHPWLNFVARLARP